jgi:hypothetical protein
LETPKSRIAVDDGLLAPRTVEVMGAIERLSDGCEKVHHLPERERRFALRAPAHDDGVERFSFEPFEHQERHERAVRRRHHVHVERADDVRGAR